MWGNGRTPAYVIDHGILPQDVSYSGDIEKGIVIINNLSDRGRRLGYDIFEEVRERLPLDLIGMDTEKLGGLGEILHPQLPGFISRYRFFFKKPELKVTIFSPRHRKRFIEAIHFFQCCPGTRTVRCDEFSLS